MNPSAIRRVLELVHDQGLSVDEALSRLRGMPFEDLGFARVDGHRSLRCGIPEVIFGAGKRVEDAVRIAESIVASGANLLATRVSPEMAQALVQRFPSAVHNERARTVALHQRHGTSPDGAILILTAGTSDIPVAEEARVTAEIMDNKVQTLYDVGVAGLHRLLSQHGVIQEANVLIVVAGMEGALASVVGGLVARPVIAVPTSVGYGASFNGLAPLLTMLNSCAAGVSVVNIDNGFGAGCVASLINHTGMKDETC